MSARPESPMLRALRQRDLDRDVSVLTMLAWIVAAIAVIAAVEGAVIILLDLAATGESSLLRAISAFMAELDGKR